MSSFNCEYCGTAIIDTPRGYVTSCEHHKAENINMLRSKHLEGDCHCHGSIMCNGCLDNIAEDINELASNSLDVNNKGILMAKMSLSELESIHAVVEAGRRHGFGNMIAHLRREWALMLMKDVKMTYEKAVEATNASAYPEKLDGGTL